MKFSKAFVLILPTFLLLAAGSVRAEGWVFLPSDSLFRSMAADPREPHTGLLRDAGRSQWEGSIGRTVELLRSPPKICTPLLTKPFLKVERQWAWGVTASAHAWLDQRGSSFPMRANDWLFGTYFSYSRVKGSLDDPSRYLAWTSRLEYTHESTHLGDELFAQRDPIVYSRETAKWLVSVEATSHFRLYAGAGGLIHSIPQEPAFFAQGGVEVYGMDWNVLGQPMRPYLAYDAQDRREAGGVFNQSAQLGFQWRNTKDRKYDSIRFVLSYYRGQTPFGQFFREREERWAFGFFFGP